jgi:hypothetical protein
MGSGVCAVVCGCGAAWPMLKHFPLILAVGKLLIRSAARAVHVAQAAAICDRGVRPVPPSVCYVSAAAITKPLRPQMCRVAGANLFRVLPLSIMFILSGGWHGHLAP